MTKSRLIVVACVIVILVGIQIARSRTSTKSLEVVALPATTTAITADLRTRLTPLQYKVTQEEGTETPFQNEYWDTKDEGIYVDIVSGEVLFSSKDKYDSKTGWPSFTKPLVAENIVQKKDSLLGFERTEIRSKQAKSHLGHLFDDGPSPLGTRYCMNSAALRFVAKRDLATQGYGEYVNIF